MAKVLVRFLLAHQEVSLQAAHLVEQHLAHQEGRYLGQIRRPQEA